MRLAVGALLLSVVVGLTLVLVTATGTDAQTPQPGLWEITASMETPGMSMPPKTITQCIRDTDNPDSLIPTDQSCVIENKRAVGNKLSWTMRCQQGNTVMTGTGELTLSGSSYEGVSQITVREGSGEAVNMSSRYSARRVGNC